MPTPRILSRRPVAGSPLVSALLAGIVACGALGAAAIRPAAVAAETAVAEVSLLAGPGWEYEVLTVVPAGAWMSVDGEVVNGFAPVTAQGVSGWVEAWAVGPDQAAQDAAVDDGYADDGAADVAYEGDYAAEGGDVPDATYDDAVAATGDGSGEYAADATYDGGGDAAGVTYDDGGYAAEDVTYAADGSGAVVSEEPVYSEEAAAAPAPAPDLAPPAGASTAAGGRSDYSEREIIGIIEEAARAHGQNANAMVRVARCESGLNPNAVGAGQYYGLFQFVPSTFAGTPYGDGDIFDPWANAHAAAWMWEQGRKGEWVCQ